MRRGRDETVVLDFDGVIHQCNIVAREDGIILEGPVDGAREAIRELRKRYFVVVCSARCRSEAGRVAIGEWLRHHRIVVDDITGQKVPAKAYVDDRAVCFSGNWEKVLKVLRDGDFRPWNRKGRAGVAVMQHANQDLPSLPVSKPRPVFRVGGNEF